MSRIVVGVDGSAHGDRALQWAVQEAELRAATVELVHGYVINTRFAMFGTSDRERAQARMDEIVGAIRRCWIERSGARRWSRSSPALRVRCWTRVRMRI
jgi:nucleotide-binding universal stress UspA family protein